jgi:hypothetical protein
MTPHYILLAIIITLGGTTRIIWLIHQIKE